MKHKKRNRPLNSFVLVLLALSLVTGCHKADQATRDLQAATLDKRYRPEVRFDENATAFDNLKVKIGDLAPVISGPDTDGIQFSLSDYRGKVVLLQYWANW